MRLHQRLAIRSAVACAALALARPAAAHGLAERYTLPIPLSLYLAGAAATVAVSFALLAIFARREWRADDPRCDLSRWWPSRALLSPVALAAGRAVALALLALIVAAAFLGHQSPFKNLAPVMVWVIGWVGLAFLCVLVGDVWNLLSPWATVFAWAEALAARLRPGRRLALDRPWPAWLGAWPAVLLFLVFAWMELVWPGRDHPRSLGAALLAYSALTWTGMLVFGRRAWLGGGDPFAVFFRLLARFAPIEIVTGGAAGTRAILRPPAVGLLTDRPVHPSLLVFVLLVLSSVTFDGFTETPLWTALRDTLLGGLPARVALSLGLVAFPLLFLGLYLLVARLMALAAAHRPPAVELASRFVLTLLPIAIAYHVAHYLPFLLLAGQLVIPLASDPFGRGWDLFGTSLYRLDVGVVGARFIWFTAVASIVTGHVASVVLAHATAARFFAGSRLARRSQYPMLVLMVAYTMVSLWILAQPVVDTA
ncbi:MAG: hypothetical protein HY615_04070 [Candidatus Rokubacteria bacterium]|nr:hypothetical protein [Candidatus Rokubacteria bacterium]